MKSKVVRMDAMKGYGGVEAQFHAFLFWALYAGDRIASRSVPLSPRYPLNSGRDEPQGRFGRFGEKKNLSPFWENTW